MVADEESGWTGAVILPSVQEALLARAPLVALESAVITHGLPYPRNLEAVQQMESAVSAAGATPAVVAVLDGQIHVGATASEIEGLAESGSSQKIGVRDFAGAALSRSSGGTTVAATMFVAAKVGIHVFATGGIGGVHREYRTDISADLVALAQTSMIVVCAGVKAVLDLPATMEYLETMSVPILGYGTHDLPAFYSRSSGLKTSGRADSPQDISEYWAAHRALGMRSAVLVANAVPEDRAIPREELEELIGRASRAALQTGIHGQALTPFLLQRLAEPSNQRTIDANVALLVGNARLAAEIAVAVTHHQKGRSSEA